MTTEQVQAAIDAVIAHTGGKFRPRGEPTLTPGGAYVQFEHVKVSPETVCSWFGKCGYFVYMIAYNDPYSKQPFMVLEWR